MKNVSFWFGSGAHVRCYYYFSHLLKVTFFANKQTQETSNSSLYIVTKEKNRGHFWKAWKEK